MMAISTNLMGTCKRKAKKAAATMTKKRELMIRLRIMMLAAKMISSMS